MKKKITILSMLALSVHGFAQTPITLTSVNTPIPTIFNSLEMENFNPAELGSNLVWDFSNLSPLDPSGFEYSVETIPFYTSVGIERYSSASKSFNADFGYNIYNEFDFSTNGLDDKGLNIPAQGYSLGAMTGDNNDSLTFPEQDYILSSPRRIIQFPMTANSSWSTQCPKVGNFFLKIAAYGLNNTPSQHRYTIHRTDSIVGWGKLSVYTSAGASIQYDVLMDKYSQYAVDSFFVGGAPAPQALTNGLGVTQGQQSNIINGYNFYRAGSYNYLMRLSYGLDNTFTNLSKTFMDTDNITTATSTANLNENASISYQSLVFPNPSAGNSISVKLLGKKVNNPEIKIFDVLGNLIQTEKFTQNSMDSISITFNKSIKNGNYILQVIDENNKVVVKENITINQ